MNPFISVIIPTYKRHHILPDTVRYLLDQDYPNYEIIVVDQTEEVPDSIEVFFDTLDAERVRYIHINEIGLPNARNVGIREARGDIVLFLDDDIVPFGRSLVEYHVENYSDPDIVGVVGRVDDPRTKAENDPKKILKLSMWGIATGGCNGTIRTKIDVTCGGNMSFRKSDCIEAGLFDRCIIGSAEGEDTEFCLRLRKKSHKSLIFDPRAALRHYPRFSGGCESRSIHPLQRHLWRFHNMTLICLRNKDIVNPVLFLIARLVSIIRISLKSRSIRPLFWLGYAIYFGYSTYRKGEADKGVIAYARSRLR
ncbi:glycosyltransferase family 2 protein [candidate division WOR-3 bacterium]|nr:glycosyltransferase family 2 protein [candidate division WOR-3 bacterium]MCK4328437.1 glycosyltransferase family 2 protein [candidate division WOR-3 bacterium]